MPDPRNTVAPVMVDARTPGQLAAPARVMADTRIFRRPLCENQSQGISYQYQIYGSGVRNGNPRQTSHMRQQFIPVPLSAHEPTPSPQQHAIGKAANNPLVNASRRPHGPHAYGSYYGPGQRPLQQNTQTENFSTPPILVEMGRERHDSGHSDGELCKLRKEEMYSASMQESCMLNYYRYSFGSSKVHVV